MKRCSICIRDFFFYYILLFKLKARTINSFKAERETLLQEIAVILNTEEKIQVTVFRFIILLVKERAITRRYIFYLCDTEKKNQELLAICKEKLENSTFVTFE